MPLPTNIDASYPDRDAGDALHQQHHDTVHGILNDPAANWTEGNGAYAAVDDPLGFGLVYTLDPMAIDSAQAFWTANRTWYGRCIGRASISKVALERRASSGNIAVAAYSNTGEGRSADPATRLATSGSVACPAIGYAEVSLGASVEPEWLSLGADNTTATFYAVNGLLQVSAIGAGRMAVETVYPPPATATPTDGVFKNFCLIGVA